MKTLEDRLYYYVTAMWYESKCKNKDHIRQIIHEEIQKNPDKTYNELRLPTLRRCQSEIH